MPAIRDPVHNWIKYSKAEMKIIDSPLFQRLNWVSQLSCKQIFPGGVHTRFLHSLGAMKLAGKYMSHLLETSDMSGCHISNGTLIQLARLSGLLHDIGHGPFSHAFDRSIYSQIYNIPDGGHDLHRLKMVKSDLLRPLIEGCGITSDQIIAVWNSKREEYLNSTEEWQNWFDIIRAIVQGPLGADRMDFTLRDSYFTGTTHLGTIASTRIISNTKLLFDMDANKYYLHYHTKCLSDVIQALAGRYYMYDSVYLHKTTSAANILIENMLNYSAKYLKLRENTEDLDKFQWLNDSTIIGSVMAYEGDNEDMLVAQKYCRLLLQRKFPKLEIELLIPTEKTFNSEEYLQEYAKRMGNPVSMYEIIRTRSLIGIDPNKFNKHHIYFCSGKQNKISCQDALDNARYTSSHQSHYIIRIYNMS